MESTCLILDIPRVLLGFPGQVAVAATGFAAKSVLTGCPIKILADFGKGQTFLHAVLRGLPIPSTCLAHPPMPLSLQQPPVGTPELITHCLGEGVTGMLLLWMRT